MVSIGSDWRSHRLISSRDIEGAVMKFIDANHKAPHTATKVHCLQFQQTLHPTWQTVLCPSTIQRLQIAVYHDHSDKQKFLYPLNHSQYIHIVPFDNSNLLPEILQSANSLTIKSKITLFHLHPSFQSL